METKDILKELRKRNGFNSAQEFCEAADISFNTYQNYESGKRIPTTEILIKIADFYGVTTDYLLGRTDNAPDPIEQLTAQFDMTLLEKKILEEYLKLDEKMRGDFMEFLHKAVIEVQTASAKRGETTCGELEDKRAADEAARQDSAESS